ncbi:hypothetical protein GCM10007939_26110 [Amylibacter marinus]|uniref:DUF3179 domain-containing protein n=1 Tax=Amylibacter marinus TaxID=1475483 RepID=A0ABQ5VY06_9RHOB|nr:DUF3179 domain-containing (seleno)protein [Amylibacter marinus]GLQ36327.1 hypothetical protein GCM10007939_26110 [Amylibacter marinus]
MPPALTQQMRWISAALLSATLITAPLGAQTTTPDISDVAIAQFGTPPAVPTGALPRAVRRAITTAFVDSMKQGQWGPDQDAALQTIATSKDARVVWVISDLLRFVSSYQLNAALTETASVLLGVDIAPGNSWGQVTDHLIAWDIPAPPNYLKTKREIYTTVVPSWQKIFTKGDVDWRHVSWGGVLIDDRAFGTTDEPCNCIPAADDPATTSADQATWLDEDDIVFGIEVNGAFRAYPRQIMEVREMVNDTLGGRDLGIPYCTLCGSAQAYFTDQMPAGVKRPVLRTSGLLIRSNKVMYDLNTYSVFDTFKGTAVTGPLANKGITLPQASVVTTTWGDWKSAHPETTVLAEYLALGRDPDFRNTRDADGPIFPVGDVDPRLGVHEDIIGVVAKSGTPVAFQRTKALVALQAGQEVGFENIRLALDAGGIRAIDTDGHDLGSHQAFWFAWSQFHPTTRLWSN